MSKHTPGPWRLEEVADRSIKHLCPVADVDGLSLLTVVYTDGYDGNECIPFAAVYRDADAHLIFASPDMYKALVMVRDADEDCKRDGLPTIPPTARAEIDAAIAKAEGK